MKKHIYMAAIAALAIVSCSKDEIKDANNGQAIDFRTMMTRAAEVTTAGLSDIWVTATSQSETNYFTDLQFSRNGDYFKSETSYYWPSDGSTLQFYAYSPCEESFAGDVNIDKTSQSVTGFTPAADITDQVDFIVATASGSKDDAKEGVGLVFDHALSQIEIKALSSNAGYVYKVAGVRIGKVISKGDFNFASKGWSLSSEKADYEVLYNNAPRTLTEEAQTLMASENDNAMLIPQQLVAWNAESDKTNEDMGSYLAVLVNISTSAGAQVFPQETEAYGWIATPIDAKWDDGFKYVYTLDLKDGGIVAPDTPVDPDNPDDPFKPGDDVLAGKISFTSNMISWTTANNGNSYSNIEM